MKTVLFDMDGTLLDTLEDLSASANYALAQAGLEPVTKSQVREAAGYASVVLMDTLSGHCFDVESESFKNLWMCFLDHYNEHHGDTTRPYPGILELLGRLKKAGVRMAVVSNKRHEDTEQLRLEWFADYVPVAVGFTPERPRKPAPDMLFAALDLLGDDIVDTVYVGDSQPDVQIAQNAGCASIAVTWGFRTRSVLEAENPDFIVDTPQELYSVLQTLWKLP